MAERGSSLMRRADERSAAKSLFVAGAIAFACAFATVMLGACVTAQNKGGDTGNTQTIHNELHEAAPPKEPTFDVNNANDKKKLSAFLTSFSEVGLCDGADATTFSKESATVDEFAQLAISRLAIEGSLEEAQQEVGGMTYGYRASTKSMDAVLNELLGEVSIDWSRLAGGKGYAYKDGHVYADGSRVQALRGPVVVTDVASEGDGNLKVTFNAYYQPASQTGYVRDGKLLAATEEQITTALDVRGANRSCKAVVRPRHEDDGWHFALVSYDVTSIAGMDEPTHDDPAVVQATIDGFEQRRAEIETANKSDRRMAGSTAEMLEGGNDYVEKLTSLMNDMHAFLDGRIGIDSDSLAASQEAWEADTNAAMDAAGAQMRGSMSGIARLSAKMDALNQRLDALFAMAYGLL